MSRELGDDPEDIMLELLKDNQIIINNGWWNKDWPKDHITVHLICNDVFAWGCADSEDILYTELKDAYEHWMKDKRWGIAVFCIKKRKLPPQKPVLDAIKKDSIWPIEEIVMGFDHE